MTAAAKGSVGGSQLYTKDEATAAQRTWVFHLCKTADQADCTAVVPVVTISKAGGAFGAAAGVVSELANGFYKMVWDAADLDTLGCLAARVAVATADTLDAIHQVIALDINVATVNPGAGGIVAASFGANALAAAAFAADVTTELQNGLATAAGVDAITLATRTVLKDLGRMEEDGHLNTDEEYVAISILDAIDATVEITGTWNGATATVYVTNDPAATVPVWTEYDDTANDNPLTADGTVIVAGGGISAVKVEITNDGAATDLGVTVSIRKPANT